MRLPPLIAMRQNCVLGRMDDKGKILELFVPAHYSGALAPPGNLIGLTLRDMMPTEMEATEMGLVLKMVMAFERPYSALYRLEHAGRRGVRTARILPGKGDEVLFYQNRISPSDWSIPK